MTYNRIEYTKGILNEHKIEYAVVNFETQQFHCFRKSDDKMIEYFAGTGTIKGFPDKKGIHNLVAILDDIPSVESLQEQIDSLNKTINAQMLTIANLRKEVLRDFVECITVPENITKIDHLNYIWESDIKRLYYEKTGEVI